MKTILLIFLWRYHIAPFVSDLTTVGVAILLGQWQLVEWEFWIPKWLKRKHE